MKQRTRKRQKEWLTTRKGQGSNPGISKTGEKNDSIWGIKRETMENGEPVSHE